MVVLGKASQDGPRQKENKHRSEENVVTPRSKEKDAFVFGGRGRGAGSEACGMGQLLPLSWVPGSLEEAPRDQDIHLDGRFRSGRSKTFRFGETRVSACMEEGQEKERWLEDTGLPDGTLPLDWA
eukprot:XP_017453222.1 PREDICTED: uncharacterized protein LOC102549836 isoform X2 [Rattus norvegicus]